MRLPKTTRNRPAPPTTRRATPRSSHWTAAPTEQAITIPNKTSEFGSDFRKVRNGLAVQRVSPMLLLRVLAIAAPSDNSGVLSRAGSPIAGPRVLRRLQVGDRQAARNA